MSNTTNSRVQACDLATAGVREIVMPLSLSGFRGALPPVQAGRLVRVAHVEVQDGNTVIGIEASGGPRGTFCRTFTCPSDFLLDGNV